MKFKINLGKLDFKGIAIEGITLEIEHSVEEIRVLGDIRREFMEDLPKAKEMFVDVLEELNNRGGTAEEMILRQANTDLMDSLNRTKAKLDEVADELSEYKSKETVDRVFGKYEPKSREKLEA